MNAIDLIVCLVAVWAVWSGWHKGCVRQVCSLAGFVAAIYLASTFGAEVGGMLHLDAEIAEVGGFVVVLLAAIIVVGIAGRLLKGLFQFAGLGVVDVALGIVLSVVKFALLLSVLFSAFDSLNNDYKFIAPAKLATSYTYRPVKDLARHLLPMVKWMGAEVAELMPESDNSEI